MFYSQNGRSLSLIQKNTGYFFNNEQLLINALVHSSFAHEYKDSPISHNERLEFLGDAVLNLIICHYLMNKYPGYREGDLSVLKSYLVSEPVLARVAQGINLGAYLLLGKGEEQNQGRKKRSLLADALEALIAAIYLDGGLEPVRLFVINQFSDQLEKVHTQRHLLDYKSLLQEYTQARFSCRPKYELIGQEGPAHNRLFKVKLSVNGQVWASGRGRSKKEAEVETARKAIEGLRETENIGEYPLTGSEQTRQPDTDLI